MVVSDATVGVVATKKAISHGSKKLLYTNSRHGFRGEQEEVLAPFSPMGHDEADLQFFQAYSAARQQAGLGEILADAELSLSRTGLMRLWLKDNVGSWKKFAFFTGRLAISLSGADVVWALFKGIHQGAFMHQHTYLKKKEKTRNVLHNLRGFLDSMAEFVRQKAKAGGYLESVKIEAMGKKNFFSNKEYSLGAIIEKYKRKSGDLEVAEESWLEKMRLSTEHEERMSRLSFFKKLYGRVFNSPTLEWIPPPVEHEEPETRVTQLLQEIDLLAGQTYGSQRSKIQWRVAEVRRVLAANAAAGGANNVVAGNRRAEEADEEPKQSPRRGPVPSLAASSASVDDGVPAPRKNAARSASKKKAAQSANANRAARSANRDNSGYGSLPGGPPKESFMGH